MHERTIQRQKETAEIAEQRETSLRLGMGSPENKLRITSIEALRDVHPNALKATGVQLFIDRTQRMSLSTSQILRTIQVFEFAIGENTRHGRVSSEAIDFLINERRGMFSRMISQPRDEWFNDAYARLLRRLDLFCTSDFKFTSVWYDSDTRMAMVTCVTNWNEYNSLPSCDLREDLYVFEEGVVRTHFPIAKHSLMLAHARLKTASVENIDFEWPPDQEAAFQQGEESEPLPENPSIAYFLTNLVNKMLDHRFKMRGVAFEFLGFDHVLQQIIAYLELTRS